MSPITLPRDSPLKDEQREYRRFMDTIVRRIRDSVTDSQDTPWVSHVCHRVLCCVVLLCYVVQCYIVYISSTDRPRTVHIPFTYRPHSVHLSSTYRCVVLCCVMLFNVTLSTYRPRTSTYRPHTVHVPSIFHPLIVHISSVRCVVCLGGCCPFHPPTPQVFDVHPSGSRGATALKDSRVGQLVMVAMRRRFKIDAKNAAQILFMKLDNNRVGIKRSLKKAGTKIVARREKTRKKGRKRSTNKKRRLPTPTHPRSPTTHAHGH